MARVPLNPACRSFSLIEVVVSVLIMGVMFAAAMNSVGAARGGEYSLAEREQALLLAQAEQAVPPLGFVQPAGEMR